MWTHTCRKNVIHRCEVSHTCTGEKVGSAPPNPTRSNPIPFYNQPYNVYTYSTKQIPLRNSDASYIISLDQRKLHTRAGNRLRF